jgi:hypothetical protein
MTYRLEQFRYVLVWAADLDAFAHAVWAGVVELELFGARSVAEFGFRNSRPFHAQLFLFG